jgi:hypothetical protein
MRRLAIAAGSVVVAAFAFAVGRATAPNAFVPRVEVAAPIVPVVERAYPLRSEDALAECEKRLALAEGVLRAKEHEAVGDPVPFPDGLAPQYTPGGFEDAVKEAMRVCPDSGLQLKRVDCSEFPCMAFFTPTGRETDDEVSDLSTCDAWTERFGIMGGMASLDFMTDKGVTQFVMKSVAPADSWSFDENEQLRWNRRTDEGKAQIMADVGGRDLTKIEQLDRTIESLREFGHNDLLPALEAQREQLLQKESAQ